MRCWSWGSRSSALSRSSASLWSRASMSRAPVTGTAGLILRGVVAAVCLLPPTFLMGASLPAMSRWVETTPKGVSWMGLLYSANVAGAVSGCLLAGFYLLRVYGLGVGDLYGRRRSTWRLRRWRLHWRPAPRTHPVSSDESRGHGPGDVAPAVGTRLDLRRHRPLRTDRAGRRGRLDAATLAAAGRHRLHLLDYSGGVSCWGYGRAAARALIWPVACPSSAGRNRDWRWRPARSCWRSESPGPRSRWPTCCPIGPSIRALATEAVVSTSIWI